MTAPGGSSAAILLDLDLDLDLVPKPRLPFGEPSRYFRRHRQKPNCVSVDFERPKIHTRTVEQDKV